MNELRCPHCGQVFTVNENQYHEILAQVRNQEFDAQVHHELELRQQAMRAEQDAMRQQHQAALEAAETKRIADVQSAYSRAKAQAAEEMLAVRQDSDKRMQELQLALSNAEKDAVNLRAQIDNAENTKRTAVAEAVTQEQRRSVEMERTLREQMHTIEQQAKLEEQKHTLEEQRLTAELEFYKDLKARQSTKMVGETLEQHCMSEFMKMRSWLPREGVVFMKDNKVSQSGSKGDFIYREERNGVELISIMFEMKNETETTSTKKRNEDFLKELNKDRIEKNCEYAVLVSLLEPDKDEYNVGIVDMSHVFPKMYVIRPQFFLPLISILRNAALNALTARMELETFRGMHSDLVEFNRRLTEFREGVSMNYTRAHTHFEGAIAAIDKSIADLQKVRDELVASDKNFRILNEKSGNLTIGRLTRGLPAVQDVIEGQTDSTGF